MVMKPAGPEKAVDIIISAFLKDPTDAIWNDDPGMKEWRSFMAKYRPDADLKDGVYVAAYCAFRSIVITDSV
jgi:branched-chain amino acid transport system substrate-binding protein